VYRSNNNIENQKLKFKIAEALLIDYLLLVIGLKIAAVAYGSFAMTCYFK
jgi:hypothetical protein